MGNIVTPLDKGAVEKLDREGMYFVGVVPGLALRLRKSQARTGDAKLVKTWVLRTVIGGKRTDHGLGAYPGITLAAARAAALQAKGRLLSGVNPIEEARRARATLSADKAAAITFKTASEKYIAAHEAGWKNAKHAQQWTNTLKTHAFPVLGELHVRDIGTEHVLKVLEPIWTTTTETATRVRGRIESVLNWCATRGYRDGLNPARWRGHLDTLLPNASKVANVKHHAAMPFEVIGDFMTALKTHAGVGARALEFTVLTAARSGEVRGARWSEIDLDKAVWTIPAERMKAGRAHTVPLSPAAVTLLKSLDRIDGEQLIFPAPRGGELSDMTLTAVLRRMEQPFTVHGFRSTFRDWAAERTNFPSDVAEMALAHTIGNKVEAAYRRGDLMTKRIKMMAAWANFCATPSQSNVIKAAFAGNAS